MDNWDKSMGWNEKEKELFAKWRALTLSAGEKEDIRKSIRLKMSVSGTRHYAGNVSFELFSALTFFRRGAVAFASVAIILLVSGGLGVARAAQGSLPGEWLYPMKVRVNEPVEGWLQTGSKGKAAFESTLMERRIDEANKLVTLGRLGEKEEQEIDGLLNEHAAKLRKIDSGSHDEEKAAIQEAQGRASRVEVNSEGKDGGSEYSVRIRTKNEGGDGESVQAQDGEADNGQDSTPSSSQHEEVKKTDRGQNENAKSSSGGSSGSGKTSNTNDSSNQNTPKASRRSGSVSDSQSGGNSGSSSSGKPNDGGSGSGKPQENGSGSGKSDGGDSSSGGNTGKSE